MVVTPNVNNAPYQAASGNGWQVNTPLLTSGGTAQPPLAAQLNQFLMTHAITPHYQGVSSPAINSGTLTSQSFAGGTNGLWVAQRFLSNGSSIGYIMTNFGLGTYPDGSLNPVSVQIYTDNGSNQPGVPVTGSSQITMTPEYLYPTPLTLMMPIGVPSTSLVSGTHYWVVISGTKTSSGTESYFWQYKATADTGLYYATSSNSGSTWTNQTGGMYMQLFSDDVAGQLAWVTADGGGNNAPWMAFYRFTSPGQSMATDIFEYYPGQLAGGRMYIQSTRSLGISLNNMQTNVF